MSENNELGNVYAIKTNKGYGLFQVVQHIEKGIEVVRVLSPIIQNLAEFSQEMLNTKERYFVKFTVQAARKKQLIIFIGNYEIPLSVRVPNKYRMLDYVPHRNIRKWYVVDAKTNGLKQVSKIDEKFLELSCDGVWNDTFLRERLEEDWDLKSWK